MFDLPVLLQIDTGIEGEQQDHKYQNGRGFCTEHFSHHHPVETQGSLSCLPPSDFEHSLAACILACPYGELHHVMVCKRSLRSRTHTCMHKGSFWDRFAVLCACGMRSANV